MLPVCNVVNHCRAFNIKTPGIQGEARLQQETWCSETACAPSKRSQVHGHIPPSANLLLPLPRVYLVSLYIYICGITLIVGLCSVGFINPFLPLGVASCCASIQLVLYDAVSRNKVSIRQLPFFLFSFSLTTCFGPYGPTSGEIHKRLFLLQRIRCTYISVLRPVVPNTCYQT
jgi:hypothetical protein